MRRGLLSFLVAFFAGAAAAQNATLADPTRPPNAIAGGPGAPAVRSGPQLQSVLISPTRRIAVISGHTVALGGKYGKATVASIIEGAVLLRYPDRRKTLRLIPSAEKHERRVADASASDKGTSR